MIEPLVATLLATLLLPSPTSTQTTPPAIRQSPETPTCVPIAQRTREAGCWIITDEPIGGMPEAPVFWHLDTYATRAAAEAVKRPGAVVLESHGKVG